MSDTGDALKSESFIGRKESTMVRNVWFKAFVWSFETKGRQIWHFSSVLISEVKAVFAIKIEKMRSTYPFCMAAVGS